MEPPFSLNQPSHLKRDSNSQGDPEAQAAPLSSGRMVERLLLAKPRGFCAGVVMAIKAVEEEAVAAEERGEGGIAVYHDIVHNQTVVSRLEQSHGVTFV